MRSVNFVLARSSHQNRSTAPHGLEHNLHPLFNSDFFIYLKTDLHVVCVHAYPQEVLHGMLKLSCRCAGFHMTRKHTHCRVLKLSNYKTLDETNDNFGFLEVQAVV